MTKNYLVNFTFTAFTIKSETLSAEVYTSSTTDTKLSDFTYKGVLNEIEKAEGVGVDGISGYYTLNTDTLIKETSISLENLDKGDVTKTYVVRAQYRKTVTENGTSKTEIVTIYYRMNITFKYKDNG